MKEQGHVKSHPDKKAKSRGDIPHEHACLLGGGRWVKDTGVRGGEGQKCATLCMTSHTACL